MATERVKVVEFYAGIGGFHSALKHSGVDGCEVVASIDINTNTRMIYSHNFPNSSHLNRNICGLTAGELDRLGADAFFLSPPCQPFTRQGNQLDNKDRRTDSFFHLMHTLREMCVLPKFILMENVKGFESSQTRNEFVSILRSLDYDIREYLLSPKQFGIPNSRLRFYLLAKRKPLQFGEQNGDSEPSQDARALIDFVGGGALCPSLTTMELESDSQKCPSLGPESEVEDGKGVVCENKAQGEQRKSLSCHPEERPILEPNSLEPKVGEDAEGVIKFGGSSSHESDTLAKGEGCKPLSCYLEDLDMDTLQRYLVPEKILQKYAVALDIVQPGSKHSCCFTKAYGNYAVGTGSILQHSLDKSALDQAFQAFSDHRERADLEGSVECLRALNLRYFTPKEVANLMCFPERYGFPPGLTDKQCYKALGNSLNVEVVSVLIRYLFLSERKMQC